jgi:hypothetical protein
VGWLAFPHGKFPSHIVNLSKLSRCDSSTVATATFFLTAVVTSLVLNGDTFPAIGPTDWSLGPNIKTLLALQAVPLTIEIAQYYLVSCHLDLLIP